MIEGLYFSVSVRSPRHPFLKWSVIVSGMALVLISAALLWWRAHLPGTMEIVDVGEPIRQKAIDLYFKKLESIGSTSLTMIGVLWAFVLYPKNAGVRVRDRWSMALVIIATLLFLASFGLSAWGFDFLTDRLFFQGTFDIEAPLVSFWAVGQGIYFAAGIVVFLAIVLVCVDHEEVEA